MARIKACRIDLIPPPLPPLCEPESEPPSSASDACAGGGVGAAVRCPCGPKHVDFTPSKSQKRNRQDRCKPRCPPHCPRSASLSPSLPPLPRKPARGGILSHIMHLLLRLRRSTPPQNRQLTVTTTYQNIKLTVLWRSWLSKTNKKLHRVRD